MNNDLIKMVEYLSTEKMTTIDALEKYFHLTRRQLMYKIDKINDLLNEQSASSLNVTQNKLRISEGIRDILKKIASSYQTADYIFEKEERFVFMYIVLFIRNEEDYLSTDYFIEELQISRTTIFSDIKEFKQILQYHAIELKNNRRYGYYLSGEETAIRNALLFFFTSILTGKQNTTIFDLIIKKNKLKPFDESKKIIEEVSNRNKCFFVEKRLDEFVYIFVFLLTRIQRTEARIVNNNSLDAMTTFKEYKFTVDIIEAFGIEQRFSQQELFYVTSWTLSISFGSVDVSTKDFNLISNFVYKVMDRFNLLSGYQYDFTDGFFNQLYVHMRPAYYRLLFNIPVINSLTDRVKQEFNSLFHLVQETMKPFVSSFGQEVPESEIAYLTMHFANIIRKKEDVTTEVPSHKTANALIVCSNGIGSSAILYNELSELFPDLNFYRPVSIVKMSEFGSKVDIIFSTDHLADLYDDQIPVVRVHPIISMEERYQLLHEVNMKLNRKQNINIDKIMEVIDKHSNILNASQLRHDLTSLLMDDSSFEKPSMEVHEQETRKLKLTDLFDIELLQLSVEANNWEDAVRKSYDPLIKKSIISEKYMEKTIRGVQLKGPYIVISENIALSHSKPEDGAFENALGLTVLKKPVSFGGKPNKIVKYIFSLSINGEIDHLEAMAELVSLINDSSFFKLLDQTDNKQQVISYIESVAKQIES